MLSSEYLRKTLILTGMGLCNLMESYILGHGVGMVAALYVEKEEMNITDETISWIIAIMFAPMVLGGMAETVITERYGRRRSLTILNIPVIAHWLLLYYARDGTTIILSRLLGGFCFGGLMPTIFMAVTEYSSPEKRGSNFAFIFALGPVGGIVGQSMALVFHWRTAALIALFPTVLAAVLPLFFIENPQWLASRGRFEECEVAFRALHGYKAEKELQLLLEVEKCKFNQNKKKSQIIIELMQRVKRAATKKYFWNLMILGYVIQLYKIICGFMLKGILGVTILQHITGHSDVLKFTMLSDGLTLLGSILANFILRKVETRALTFIGGLLNNIILLIFCFLLYLKLNNDTFLPWVITFIFGLHLFVLSASIYPLLDLMPQEMYPIEIRTVCSTFITLLSTMTIFVYSKIVPGLFVEIDFYGVYLLSVLLMCFCLLFFWFKLPETKGRTLQEIELYFKNGKFVNIDDVLENDQIEGLV